MVRWDKLVLICFITALSCLKQEKCNELRKVLTTKICINGYFITPSFSAWRMYLYTIPLYEKHQPQGIKHHVVKVSNDTHYKNVTNYIIVIVGMCWSSFYTSLVNDLIKYSKVIIHRMGLYFGSCTSLFMLSTLNIKNHCKYHFQ